MIVILAGLGWFMYRNYRKEKQEAMEHDPDFDENGDATALPDFPAFTKEDPFDNRHSAAYRQSRGFPMSLPNRLMNDLRSTATRDSAHVDGFVLPYHHQIGSKASLEEFAKQLVDTLGPMKRHLDALLALSSKHGSVHESAHGSTRTSPQKSNLRYEQLSPVKMGQYTNLPFGSSGLLPAEEHSDDKYKEDFESASSKSSNFSVKYENEEDLPINSSLPNGSPRKTPARERSITREINTQPPSTVNYSEHTIPLIEVKSPFEDQSGVFEEQANQSAYLANITHPTERMDGDFDFSNESLETTPPPESRPKQVAKVSKSPRMSAFNMLQNVTDDEDETPGDEVYGEQEEQIERMKSVYNVYFDRSNSTKTVGGQSTFQSDPAHPLPTLNVDRLRINRELKGDTQYDKRKTTTSSIYEEAPIFVEERLEQLFAPQPQQYQLHDQSFLLNYTHQSEGADLPPLKSLPHASDIRHSTIETFTDYQPRKVSSPTVMTLFNPLDNESSPYVPSQSTFGSPGTPDSELPPSTRKFSPSNHPSASQLSRASVVMLNPVTEITSLRKFKPAGSLPSGARGSPALHNDEFANSSDDLIPGNRKSQVRRMMNTNF